MNSLLLYKSLITSKLKGVVYLKTPYQRFKVIYIVCSVMIKDIFMCFGASLPKFFRKK